MTPHQKLQTSQPSTRIAYFLGCALALTSLDAITGNTAQAEVQNSAPSKTKNLSLTETSPTSTGLSARTRNLQGALATALHIQTQSDFQIFYGRAKEATEKRNGKFYRKQRFDESSRLIELTTSYGEPKTNFLYKGNPIDTCEEIVDGKVSSHTQLYWKNGELEKSKTTYTGQDGSLEREYLYSFSDSKSGETLTIKNPDGSLFTERTLQPGTDRTSSFRRNMSLYTPGKGISGSRIENVEYLYVNVSKEGIRDAYLQRPGPGIGESMRMTMTNTFNLPLYIIMYRPEGTCEAEYYTYKYDKTGNWTSRNSERHTGVTNEWECERQAFSSSTRTDRTITYYQQKPSNR